MEERAAIAATPVENKAGFSHLDLSRTQLDTGPCRTRCDAVEPIRSRRRLIHYSTRSSKAESSENKSGREGGREGERERERELSSSLSIGLLPACVSGIHALFNATQQIPQWAH
jgi:hypothetical protein